MMPSLQVSLTRSSFPVNRRGETTGPRTIDQTWRILMASQHSSVPASLTSTSFISAQPAIMSSVGLDIFQSKVARGKNILEESTSGSRIS